MDSMDEGKRKQESKKARKEEKEVGRKGKRLDIQKNVGRYVSI